MSRAINWVFTINNPTPADEYSIINKMKYKYLIYQYELGENSTVHIQGYVVLRERLRLSQLKSINSRAHWSVRKGNHQQARDYCKKTDTQLDGPYIYGSESGIAKGRGQRTDLIELKSTIDSGATMVEIADKHFAEFLRYERSIKSYQQLKIQPRDQNITPEILIYWGPSGTGKTRKAIEENPDAYIKQKPEGTQDFWSQYTGQKTIIFDEFYSWIPYDKLLRICDRYPYVVNIKGTDYKLPATKFIFTSNQNPEGWYKKVKNQSAWARRVQEWGKIYYFDKDGTIVENGGPPYEPEPEEENFRN